LLIKSAIAKNEDAFAFCFHAQVRISNIIFN
jgi:hypothetical protein